MPWLLRSTGNKRSHDSTVAESWSAICNVRHAGRLSWFAWTSTSGITKVIAEVVIDIPRDDHRPLG
jgi:hypothetical protein